MLPHSFEEILTAMGVRGRYQRLFRCDFPYMALNPYSNGKSHAPEMAESWVHGKTRSLPNGSRNSAGRDMLTRISQYGPGWIRSSTTREIPGQSKSLLQMQTISHTLRPHLYNHR